MSNLDDKSKKDIYDKIIETYNTQSDSRYAAARMWIDEIIDPRDTRKIIIESLDVVRNERTIKKPRFGALQV